MQHIYIYISVCACVCVSICVCVCVYLVEGGVLKVCKGASFVMKGLRQCNLYILQGSTIIGSAAVSISSFDDNPTCL